MNNSAAALVPRVWIPAWLLSMGMALGAPHFAQAEGVALTFDDLPLNGTLAPGMTRVGIVDEVLKILKAHDVPSVYGFVNGARVADAADGTEALQHWVDGGQRVGNHTYTHSDLNEETADQFLDDVARNEPVLAQLDPGDAWQWFRYPYLREGDTLKKRKVVRAALQARGYQIAQVTLDYEDYLWNSPYARCLAKGDEAAIARLRSEYLSIASEYLDADRQMAQLVFGRPIPHVLLLHLGAFSSTILPDLLELLKQKAFTLETLATVETRSCLRARPECRFGAWRDAAGAVDGCATSQPPACGGKALQGAGGHVSVILWMVVGKWG